MNQFDCADLDSVLEGDRPEDLAAAVDHGKNCRACREELAAWSEIRRLTPALHTQWSSPGLWPRIEESLRMESSSNDRPAADPEPVPFRNERRRFASAPLLRLAAVLLLATGLGGITWWTLSLRPATSSVDQWALEESALENVEQAEQAHLRSIDALEKIVEPKMESAPTPLMVSYREKLMMLDSAIAECEGQIQVNRSNSRLRKELLSIYNEKQKTLQQLVKEGRNAQRSAETEVQ